MATISDWTRTSLTYRLDSVRSGCTSCGECVKECSFLKKHGTPKAIVQALEATDPASLRISFECSMCGLCSAVCPEGLDLEPLFLEMRREVVARGVGTLAEHNPLIAYERIGTSPRFTLYRLPKQCTTVFFPGCSLSGTRPEGVKRLFAELQKVIPTIGIAFDCCMKPSHLLGREEHASAAFREMQQWLVQMAVEEVLVACPNCQGMFEALGQGLRVSTVWEKLDASGLAGEGARGVVTVHDPCVIRGAEPVHRAVRSLLTRQGLEVQDMPHSGARTVCCGKGGAVDMVSPELASNWGEIRKREAAGRRVVTYCAGCVQALGAHTPTDHLVDLLFAPEETLAGKKKGAGFPFTYLNRLLLKRVYLNKEGFVMTRERAVVPAQEGRKKSWKPLVILSLLAAAVAIVQLSGVTQYLQQDRLQAAIGSYGALAPAIYILVYALAPVLFLPGLPITIVGGILFGPFWGVVYTIVGSTTGASLAFLVARYVARDWVAAKLTNPKWAKLDSEVAEHGWKVVAFTRLIPAFPFNLLNYAFGLTNISFAQYAVATFICMLPACIAFIVFSSSLLSLARGSVSPTALIGVGLIAAVSLLPVLYRRRRGPKPVEVTEP